MIFLCTVHIYILSQGLLEIMKFIWEKISADSFTKVPSGKTLGMGAPCLHPCSPFGAPVSQKGSLIERFLSNQIQAKL